MGSLDRARETQLKNIQAKTGKTLDQLCTVIRKSGLTKHGEIRTMLQKEMRLGCGDANSLVMFALQSDGQSAAAASGTSTADLVAAIYSGNKAPLRPVHDKVMAAIAAFGNFEIAPKKGYLSLRRQRQFAMVGPKTITTVEVGLNAKGLKAPRDSQPCRLAACASTLSGSPPFPRSTRNSSRG